MGNSGPAVLSSAMMARKGVAVPTGYTQQQPLDSDSAPQFDDTVQPLKAVKPAPVALGGGTPPSDRVRARFAWTAPATAK